MERRKEKLLAMQTAAEMDEVVFTCVFLLYTICTQYPFFISHFASVRLSINLFICLPFRSFINSIYVDQSSPSAYSLFLQGQGSDSGVYIGVDSSSTEKPQETKKRQRSPRGDQRGEVGTEHQDKRSKEEKKHELQKAQDNGQQEEAFKSWLSGLRRRREVR